MLHLQLIIFLTNVDNMFGKIKRELALLLFLTITWPLASQNIALKSNLIYDATATLNLGVEVKFAPKWTVDLSGNYNPFSFGDNKKWKHWMVQPELRYWFCDPFNRHFVGAHLMVGVFNVGNIKPPFGLLPSTKGYRYEGEMMGAGLVYGYHHVLSPRWSLEYALGLGWMHADYEKYECPHCGDYINSGQKDFFGVTKAAVSLIYMID